MGLAMHEFPPPPRSSKEKLVNGTGHVEDQVPGGLTPSHSMDMDIVAESSTSGRIIHEMDVNETYLPVLHVEVRLRPGSNIQSGHLRQIVSSYIQSNHDILVPETLLEGWEDVDILQRRVDRIWIAERSDGSSLPIPSSDVELGVYIYTPTLGVQTEDFGADTEDRDEEEGDHVPAATVKELPAPDIDGLWDNLIYSDDLKERLLRYIFATMRFADAGIDSNVISWNRMVLLHGPPGTGKTSLCRALAQKLSIRLSETYFRGKLVEINSHSLFSKWFSESGKLVQKLFTTVEDMASDQETFVVVMIDEVESLTAARAGAMTGNEPSDAVRVVNALLTGLDRLKPYKNILVMTTSNIAGAIDPAFVDRADIKEFVDYPPPQAVYMILSACLTEIMGKGLVQRQDIAPWASLAGSRINGAGASGMSPSATLKHLAIQCHKYTLAGRFLRRLPVLSYARYLAATLPPSDHRPLPLSTWLSAMERVIQDEQRSRTVIAEAEGHRGDKTGITKVKVDAEN
ncbi:P-loop containing nucleoside triphosphate hydrolase protein [Kockovaella imperatae]|uniref:p-loop containing nucleoside triphosphate hydrolase protein n=1 Tax=Kockovaella imperatae TaxID=4999 RepID=A0A1Y1U9T4_9TREE|nr:P-loop containing nucleoside triphosphate hydrolase protein [Kockovaella imperatae]ORX34793.1 P-loop containing nucleoside triphosphate hydrolase protein [Kockovaella imperatae]